MLKMSTIGRNACVQILRKSLIASLTVVCDKSLQD